MEELQQAYGILLQMEAYEEVVTRHADPNNYRKWKKYTRLRQKLIQWQNNI
jgi:hypothetical protein